MTTVDTSVDSMPSSVTDMQPLIKEFMDKFKHIKQEQELLKNDEKELFEEYKDCDPVHTSKEFSDDLRFKLNLPIADIDSSSSKFFREVFVNPPRTNTALTEKDVTWDL
jgi:hypothetical protein